MEGEPQTCPGVTYPADSEAEIDAPKTSAVFVANIQEVKDRISEIENLFCRQLFPDYEAKCRELDYVYSEAGKAAEYASEREKELLLEIEKLQFEKQRALEDNCTLKLENAEFEKFVRPSLECISNLQDDLKEKSLKILSLEEKVNELQVELGSKAKQVDKEKEFHDYLRKKCESEMLNNERLLKDYEKEKRLLTEELREKSEEVEEGRQMQGHLRQQIDLNGLEILKSGREIGELQKERSLYLVKLKVLEEKVDKLQLDLRERSIESVERMELHAKLLKQIEAKDFELISERKKRRTLIDSYKKLKSQYNFLCSRSGLTPENMNQNPLTSPGGLGSVGKTVITSLVNCELNRQRDEDQENLIDNQVTRLIQRSRSDSPSSSRTALAAPGLANVKSGLLSGTKRPDSHWRETRSHQNRVGPDPHDDFFNTPLENMRGNLKKAMKEKAHDFPDPIPKDMDFHSSDDETQDLKVDSAPAPASKEQKISPPPKPGAKGFKYVEPVRKKAERETLKGIECKQCKKFYDAVLPDGGGKDGDGNKQNLRCEHHDGVSRHRYRFAPPLTPEGFWNIGFESEM